MGESILHITNGDRTTNYLQKLKFSGEFITWREILCEGKTTADVGSEDFWKNRFEFFKTTYNINKQKFINYTLKEYRNLCNKKNQKEIVLWFEHDLSCQINMLAIISWLKRYRKGCHISLVCDRKFGNSEKRFSLSELNGKELKGYFKNRVELTKDDIEYADYIWQLYCSESPLRLETVYKFNPMSPFQYLTTAIEAHLKRFPSIENGLNSIENTILKTVDGQKIMNKKQLISILIKEEVSRFEELRCKHNIKNLSKLFSSFNPVKLSKEGKEVLENQLNFYGQIRNDISYLGGSKKYSFLYQKKTKKLLQITT